MTRTSSRGRTEARRRGGESSGRVSPGIVRRRREQRPGHRPAAGPGGGPAPHCEAVLRGRRRAGTAGSVLLDLLVALLICSVAVLLTLGGIALAARAARVARERTFQMVGDRNRDAETWEPVFTRQILSD